MQTIPNTILFQPLLDVGKSLLEKHGLNEWTFTLDQAKRRAGCCHFDKKQISVSLLYASKTPQEKVTNTILHEIAHAIAGKKHNHDAYWKHIAISIGCDGERCHNENFASGNVIQYCKNGCWGREMLRMTTSKYKRTCKYCKGDIGWKDIKS
jgi:predicted SprT family Zn-dependent metalloprotease